MAKKTDEAPDFGALQAENERLREHVAASNATQNQMLDMLTEMQQQVAALSSRQTESAPKLTERDALTEELDAELVAITEEFKDFPGVAVFERRALEGVDASLDIRLQDEPGTIEDPRGANRKWKLRWFNLAKEGRAARAEAEGYVKVEWRELRSDESLGIIERKDAYVRKGDQGSEVLYKTPMRFYEYKRKRDAARTDGLLSSESRLRDHLSNGVAGMADRHGMNADQAGSTVHNEFSLSITQGQTERINSNEFSPSAA